jgi:hypothetical protein
MAVITIKPLITAGAYSAKDIISGLIELPLREIYHGCRCMLESITVTDLAAQTADYAFLFFNQKPSNGTYSDGAALDLHDTDAQYCIGMVYLDQDAADPEITVSLADNLVMCRSNIGLPLEAVALGSANASSFQENIWLLATNYAGTPTYASVNDLTFKFGFREIN